MDQHTIELLKECDAGIKMGVASINEVLDYVSDDKLLSILTDGKEKHEKIRADLETLLSSYHDDGKEPSPMAKGMSWMKTNVKLLMKESDKTIADLMTDGCNMGVKQLSRYLNQYNEADKKARDLAERLIDLEASMAVDVRPFL